MIDSHDRSSESIAAASGVDVLSDTLRSVRLTGCDAVSRRGVHALGFVGAAGRNVPAPRASGRAASDIVPYRYQEAAGRGLPAHRRSDLKPASAGYSTRRCLLPRRPARGGAHLRFRGGADFFRRMAAGKLPSTVFEGGDGPVAAQFICGFLGCDLRPFNPVLSALPRLLRVRPAAQTGDGLPHLIAFALEELREQRSGGQVVKLRMAELLFVDVIRRHLETLPGEKAGWLAGLRNPLVARALALLHDAPAQSWTLDALAAQAGTSRSVLAERFAHFIGQPPMQYLRQLRMQLASRLLAEDRAKVASVAAAVGFESEAAFSRAFKKCVGLSPDEWRRRRGE